MTTEKVEDSGMMLFGELRTPGGDGTRAPVRDKAKNRFRISMRKASIEVGHPGVASTIPPALPQGSRPLERTVPFGRRGICWGSWGVEESQLTTV